MAIHNRAGQPAQQSDLINVAQLTAQYYVLKPEAGNAEHAVKFGTSGHRGSAARHSFNEPHILAIAQAIAEERAKNGITGPCYVGKDTHALSEPAFISVLEVLAANGVDVIVQENNGFTPTPAVSNAILVHNKKGGPLADGIVITPSHNPPEDGGIKYNPPNGGPADTNVTKVVEDRANALLADGLKGVKRISLDEAMASGHVKEQDLVQPFVEGLADIVDMAAIQKAGLTLGVDPLGGSGIEYWKRIGEYYNLTLTMPDPMSIERRKLLKALGANLVLTEGAKGMKGAIQKAEEIVASNPEKYLLLQQFSNPANPEIHEKTTGPEIWEDTDGQVDVFIAGVGTGGTLTGVSRYIKGTKGKTDLISVAVEPTDSPVIAQALAGEEIKPGPHKIQGIGAGFIPANLDLKLVDKVIGITNEEAISTARRLMEEEGILAGISSGAAVAAALKLQEDESFTNKNIVVILPSSGERYLSTALFADLFTEKELQQ